ncbi:MAG: hypothetical protein AAFU56_06390 [Pseudomonadota bacterium]
MQDQHAGSVRETVSAENWHRRCGLRTANWRMIFAKRGFHVLAREGAQAEVGSTDLPIVVGNWETLSTSPFSAALIRPDGYAACGIHSAKEADELLSHYRLV